MKSMRTFEIATPRCLTGRPCSGCNCLGKADNYGDGSLARWSLGKSDGNFSFSPYLVPVEKTAIAWYCARSIAVEEKTLDLTLSPIFTLH